MPTAKQGHSPHHSSRHGTANRRRTSKSTSASDLCQIPRPQDSGLNFILNPPNYHPPPPTTSHFLARPPHSPSAPCGRSCLSPSLRWLPVPSRRASSTSPSLTRTTLAKARSYTSQRSVETLYNPPITPENILTASDSDCDNNNTVASG